MRIHYLQHVSFEGPVAIAEWAGTRGHELTGSSLYRGDPLPALADFDWLVVMGGPMGVADVGAYAWIDSELRLIRDAIESGRRVLGICLGAQFIARAFGARVYPAGSKEIGWFPVEANEIPIVGAFDGFPARFTPLHWHSDTFDLPSGAVHLAHGPSCPNQAFQVGSRVLGLQFHLESTPASVNALVDHCASEIGDGPWEMASEDIRDCTSRCAAVSPVLDDVLIYLEGSRKRIP